MVTKLFNVEQFLRQKHKLPLAEWLPKSLKRMGYIILIISLNLTFSYFFFYIFRLIFKVHLFICDKNISNNFRKKTLLHDLKATFNC